jgi:hypothetical protein
MLSEHMLPDTKCRHTWACLLERYIPLSPQFQQLAGWFSGIIRPSGSYPRV